MSVDIDQTKRNGNLAKRNKLGMENIRMFDTHAIINTNKVSDEVKAKASIVDKWMEEPMENVMWSVYMDV